MKLEINSEVIRTQTIGMLIVLDVHIDALMLLLTYI